VEVIGSDCFHGGALRSLTLKKVAGVELGERAVVRGGCGPGFRRNAQKPRDRQP
jgi:hypothetical protein